MAKLIQVADIFSTFGLAYSCTFNFEVNEGIIIRGFLSGFTVENRWRKIHFGGYESKDGMGSHEHL